MRLLLDESLPRDLVGYLENHEVRTVDQMGWKGAKNGKLLRRAAASGFEALVTADKGFEHQHNLAKLPLTILLLRIRSNRLADIVPLVPKALTRLKEAGPREFIRISE